MGARCLPGRDNDVFTLSDLIQQPVLDLSAAGLPAFFQGRTREGEGDVALICAPGSEEIGGYSQPSPPTHLDIFGDKADCIAGLSQPQCISMEILLSFWFYHQVLFLPRA